MTEVNESINDNLENEDGIDLSFSTTEANDKLSGENSLLSDEIPNVKKLSTNIEERLNNQINARQEETRSDLANSLVFIFGCTMFASFLMLSIVILKPNTSQDNRNFTKDLVTFVITAQTGLFGTALGYYFVRNKD